MMMEAPKKINLFFPFFFSVVLAFGILIGSSMNNKPGKIPFLSFRLGEFNKLNEVINYVQQEYVDSVNQKELINSTISALLEGLDPHSAFIPAEELQAMNEPLEGNFHGIGIEFHIQDDTIMVVTAVSGGPSEALGILPGDRIIRVDGENVAGIGITNPEVMQKLRGAEGTQVTISILRRNQPDLIGYTITRGTIPLYSVDIAYLVDDSTGYVKVSRFALTTHEELEEALIELKKKGAKNLILDLRGNPGGVLGAATRVADEFLDKEKLIVYTEGKSRPRTPYYASRKGLFEKGKLVVMIDEGSASASEIVAGALQDWDRAVLVGRRSFGKGLVQEQTVFPDGSGLRLTIARYYTPSGRCIQKPYDKGIDQYQQELSERYLHGEFQNQDSITFPDSLKFITKGGRTVYGGGGIMPDYFIPFDTSATSDFLTAVVNNVLISQFSFDYVDKNRESLKKYSSFDEFDKKFLVDDDIFRNFVLYAEEHGINKDDVGARRSSLLIKTQIKAFVGRQLWKNDGFYPILHRIDNAFLKAMEIIHSKEFLVNQN